jgi:hypothetical protein
MRAGPMERKLAAIFSADVQAYSRLMGEAEEATVRTLTAYRSERCRGSSRAPGLTSAPTARKLTLAPKISLMPSSGLCQVERTRS